MEVNKQRKLVVQKRREWHLCVDGVKKGGKELMRFEGGKKQTQLLFSHKTLKWDLPLKGKSNLMVGKGSFDNDEAVI